MKKILTLMLSLLLITSCNNTNNPVEDEIFTDKKILEENGIFEDDESVVVGPVVEKKAKFYEEKINTEKISGEITYLDSPKLLEKLGFYGTDRDKLERGEEFSTYMDTESSYYLVGNLSLENGKKAELILVDSALTFYKGDELLYFVKYEGDYYLIPSISQAYRFDRDDEKDLDEKLNDLSDSFIIDNVYLKREEMFLDILRNDFYLKENIQFTKDKKTYNLKLVKRYIRFFDDTNLEKIDFIYTGDDYAGFSHKDLYIEKAGKNKIWGDEKYREIKKIQKEEWKKLKDIDDEIMDEFHKKDSKIDFFQSDAIFVKMPDNTTALYNLDVDFVELGIYTYPGGYTQENENIMNYISKSGEEKVLGHYSYMETSSCGMRNGTYMYVPEGEYRFDSYYVGFMKGLDINESQKLPDNELTAYFSEEDLEISGKMKNGTDIYSFKDKNHDTLKKMYDYGYYAGFERNGCLDKNLEFDRSQIECENIKILSYDEFVESLPAFFWKDPFGRNVLFLSRNVSQPSACGAKPVIYLYPEEKTDIQVTLDWEKKMLVSIPKYTKSWEVTSDSESNIYDKKTKSIYPYLFWEDLINYKTPEKGFVIKKEEISKFLNEKLSFIGFNNQEISDFKEFWLPKMQENNYYFITFLQTKQLDKIVPITITPKPDNILRIFMDFKGLDNFKEVEKLKLEKIDRSGFDVIEWGGRLR